MVSTDEFLEDIHADCCECGYGPDTERVKRSITLLKECLPEGARLMLSGVIERDGTVGVFSEDPLFRVEITLYGGPKS